MNSCHYWSDLNLLA